MKGMDRHTGKLIDDYPHFLQSVDTICTTAKFERVMLREFGVDWRKLLDQPTNQPMFARLYAAIAEAFLWEPRGDLKRVQVTRVTATGELDVTLQILYRGEEIDVTKLLKL